MATAAKKKANTVAKKATEAAKKTGEYASNNPKTVLYVGVGVLVIFAGYKLFKGINKAGNILSGDAIESNIEVANHLQINNNALTISSVEALQHASALLQAMNWEGYIFPIGQIRGTANDVIEAIFDKINSEDFKAIYKKFGDKHYNGHGSPPENVIGGVQDALGIAEERDLVFWLRAEINKYLDRTLFNKVKKIVEGAGFTFA